SLHFIMGPGGMHSFGHAAYFGLGAYGAALMVKFLAAPTPVALLAAPVAALMGALLFGWFAVRLSGVYLAMLTLAFAQIVWSILFQWEGVTGGSNGILGIWPQAPFDSRPAFYLMTLAVVVAGVLLLRRFLFAPCGRGATRHCARKRSASMSNACTGSALPSPAHSAASQAAFSPSPRGRSPPMSPGSRARSTPWSWCCWAASRP